MKKNLFLFVCLLFALTAAKAQCDPDVADRLTYKFDHDAKQDKVTGNTKTSMVFLTVTNGSKRNLVASFDVKAGSKVIGHFENKTPIVAGSSKKLGGKVTLTKGEHPDDLDIVITNTDCKSNAGKGVFHVGSMKAHILKKNLEDLGLF